MKNGSECPAPARRGRRPGSRALPGPAVRLALGLITGTALVVIHGTGGAGSVSGIALKPARPSAQATPQSASRAQDADRIHDVLGNRLTEDEDPLGSGTGSPCSTSSALMLTQKCYRATDATLRDAQLALSLSLASAEDSFGTLSSAAQKITAAARTYCGLGCADNPSSARTRHDCLAPAGVIAQGLPELRDGLSQ
ncbi:hypothetical protein [Kitasatospora sp. NPDC002040]|uniref:hypothetical protein n=1 Tax=Kitasatospora sp. NPDC002040 TaxID=3154661 RepID=UPI0033273837